MSGERERGFAQVNYLVQEQNNYSTLLLDLAKERNNCAQLLLTLTPISVTKTSQFLCQSE